MDSISLDIETGKYFVDIDRGSKNEEEITKGFRQFFERNILSNHEENINTFPRRVTQTK